MSADHAPQSAIDIGLLVGSDASREDQIARLLRVLETNVRVGHLLIRLQELRAQAAARRGDVLDAPAAPVSDPLEASNPEPMRGPENSPNTEEPTVVDQNSGQQSVLGEGIAEKTPIWKNREPLTKNQAEASPHQSEGEGSEKM